MRTIMVILGFVLVVVGVSSASIVRRSASVTRCSGGAGSRNAGRGSASSLPSVTLSDRTRAGPNSRASAARISGERSVIS